MTIQRRQFLRLAAGAVALPAVSRIAMAQTYPMRAVRLVVPTAPGASPDIIARLIGQWLSERLGQQFVVENKSGAGGNIGTEMVVNASPDGQTLLLASTGNAISAAIYENLNFNFIRDIAPVAAIVRECNVMTVNPSFPAKTVPEFIAYAKANPGKVNMASAGNGTSPHLCGELFRMMTGANMTHVPYRGGATAITDLIGGQVQVYFGAAPASIEYIKTGKLRALAVTTATRSDALPNVPTVGEFVPDYEASSWRGIAAPKNTPPEVIGKLNKEINGALADVKMKHRIVEAGSAALPGSSAEFGKLIAEETEKWAKVIKFAGIKAS